MGFDLWACDKDGKSIISHLIASEGFVHAKTLVEVACDESSNKSYEASVCVLNAICKDRSIRATWKPILVQMVLKSKRKPTDLNAFFRLCCTNIIDHEDTSKAEDKTTDGNSATSLSVHWEVAKLLRRYGADGKCCLDLADSCPALKDFLTKPLSIDEVPMVIPWTSYSTTHKEKLASVARGQNCKSVEVYCYQEEYIDCGTFGHVFAGINGNDGREVAIKRIETLRMVRPHDEREIQILLALSDCKQVVQYLAFYGWEDFSYIVLELMEGNLNDYFENAVVYDQTKNRILSKDVVIGLKYLHDHNIIHRDVKPSNILYKTHPKLCLKIADFGLSRRLDANSSFTVMGTNAGTRAWIAPEVVNSPDQNHTMSSDIFSCGLVLHYIFSPKRHPFDPAVYTGKSALKISNERETNVLNNKMDGWDNSLAPEVSDLLKRMLDGDEKNRPPAPQLLDHPMFWSDKKKMDLLSAVGNQPEIECPRSRRAALTAVEVDLEANATSIIHPHPHPKWDDARYTEMAKIFLEMAKPIMRGTRTIPSRKYDTSSVVELVRFIRNAMAHVSESSRPSPIRNLILSECAFLKEFPNLVMEVYNVVTKHGWDTREKIKHMHVIRN